MPVEQGYKGDGSLVRVKGDFDLFVEPGAVVIHVKDYHPGLLRLTVEELLELAAMAREGQEEAPVPSGHR